MQLVGPIPANVMNRLSIYECLPPPLPFSGLSHVPLSSGGTLFCAKERGTWSDGLSWPSLLPHPCLWCSLHALWQTSDVRLHAYCCKCLSANTLESMIAQPLFWAPCHESMEVGMGWKWGYSLYYILPRTYLMHCCQMRKNLKTRPFHYSVSRFNWPCLFPSAGRTANNCFSLIISLRVWDSLTEIMCQNTNSRNWKRWWQRGQSLYQCSMGAVQWSQSVCGWRHW